MSEQRKLDRRVRKVLEIAILGQAHRRHPFKPLKLRELAQFGTFKTIGRPAKYRQITRADVDNFEHVRQLWTAYRRKQDALAPQVTMRDAVEKWLKFSYPNMAQYRLRPLVGVYCRMVSRARGGKNPRQER